MQSSLLVLFHTRNFFLQPVVRVKKKKVNIDVTKFGSFGERPVPLLCSFIFVDVASGSQRICKSGFFLQDLSTADIRPDDGWISDYFRLPDTIDLTRQRGVAS